MTKTKEVNVQNSPSHLLFASSKERRVHLRQKMENGDGSDSGQAQHAVAAQEHLNPGSDTAEPPVAAKGEKKKINRAPSPARPKDVPGWSFTKIRGGIGTPTLSVKPGSIHLGSRVSRRSPVGTTGGKEGKTTGKSAGKSSVTKTSSLKATKGSGRRKVSDASEDLSKDSGCAVGKLSPTDSSSELSDCASDENKLSTDAVSSDTESRSSRGGGQDGDVPLRNGTFAERRSSQSAAEKENKERVCVGTGEGSVSPGDERSGTSFDSRMPASTSLAFSDLTEELMDGMQEEFVREIEELRSENDYLKDEMEELRSEMLEMRDMYMEEDVYQLQDLRQQLEQASKTCRILQYRLRKAERRSLRVAQTGQVDGELILTLEQDVKVAKDVSIRLHSQLESGEKKRTRLEEENEELRVRLQDLEVTKQVLQQELDKNSQKKRGARPNNKPEKKLGSQEDCSDLKCQLHFAKEESALMCKKLTKLVKDGESMKEELTKFRSLYGDVDASITVEEVADSPHTREAEVRVHLKLVEEEANLLSRRIVELEVENRGLRAEMDDMKQDGPQELSNAPGGPASGCSGSSSENVTELQRHLQFVEEEAELLRRSLMEMEEQNKLLMNEINRYKSELPPPTSGLVPSSLSDSPIHSIQEAAVLISPDTHHKEEELRTAKLQIGELSGKVKKLQYENRVLLSNLQRCDLASYHDSSARLSLETDAEAGDSAECLPSSPPLRKEPVGGENDEQKMKECGVDATISLLSECLRQKDHDALLAMRDQARLVSTAIQLLTSPESTCLSPSSIYHKVCSNDGAGPGDSEKPPAPPQISELSDLADWPLVGALTSRLQALHSQLHSFVECIDSLGSKSNGRDPQVDGALSSPRLDRRTRTSTDDKQPDYREPEIQSGTEENGQTQTQESGSLQLEGNDGSDGLGGQSCDIHAQLCDNGGKKEMEDKREDKLRLTQLQEEHQKALLHRDFQLQSVGLQARLEQKLWGQERSLLLQESQHLKQALLLLSLRLRCFLKQWRRGCRKDSEWKDVLEINSLKELYLLLEEDNLSPAHKVEKKGAADEVPLSPTIKSSAVSSTLADLRVALQDLSSELRQERQGSQELTQQFAKAKASWEVERTELKSLVSQLETKPGKTGPAADAQETSDLKVALKRECEEHQHLLADSYAAVMDLTKQLQIGERNWGREKLELLERFSQERAQWEQRLREQTKSKASADPLVSNACGSPRATEMEDIVLQEKIKAGETPAPDHRASRRNWTTLTDDTPDTKDISKTWDGTCSNLLGPDLESVQRSYTAPDRTGIRIYYSPPAVRRMEHQRRSQDVSESMSGNGETLTDSTEVQQEPAAASSYEQWLGSLSSQHRELLESRGGCPVPGLVGTNFTGSAGSLVASSSGFHGLEISANLSDDMKEMTNCVRQAIRSSSLERTSSKELGSQSLGVTRATQTANKLVSVGLQTDVLPGSRGAGLHSKAWSPRPSSSTTSPLASARTRQISTSLDKVHSRIDRPCCSPKFGSPKLQRRVSSGSTSRLDGAARERSVWSLQSRPGGSAWARSTTTRDSPVLNGLNDGLSSLFSVVEHSGSTESLWKSEPGISQTVSPARRPAPESQRYGGLVQEFIKNGTLGVFEEPKTEGLVGVLAGLSGDSVTRIVNKRFMRQTAGEEMVSIRGRGKETNGGTEDAPCDCAAQASCHARPSRAAARHPLAHCKHRLQDSSSSNEDKGDSCTE